MVWSLRNIFDAKSAKGYSTELALMGKKAGVSNAAYSPDTETADPATNTDGQFAAKSSLLNMSDNADVQNMTGYSDNEPVLPAKPNKLTKLCHKRLIFWITVVALAFAVLIRLSLSIGLHLYVHHQKDLRPVGNVLVTIRPHRKQSAVPALRRYAPGSHRAVPAPPTDGPNGKKGRPTEPPTMIGGGGTIDITGRKTVEDAATMDNSTEATNADDNEMTTTGPILVDDTTVENGEMTTAGTIPAEDTTVDDEEMTTAAMIKGPY